MGTHRALEGLKQFEWTIAKGLKLTATDKDQRSQNKTGNTFSQKITIHKPSQKSKKEMGNIMVIISIL